MFDYKFGQKPVEHFMVKAVACTGGLEIGHGDANLLQRGPEPAAVVHGNGTVAHAVADEEGWGIGVDEEQGRGLLGQLRICAEELSRKYPHLTITFCVRGHICLNDATRADAAAVGIPFPVIDNGNRVPGTQIDLLSREAREALDTADVILAKGMANCETMHGCGYNVYYAFLVKCQRFVERFQKPMLTPMLVKERA